MITDKFFERTTQLNDKDQKVFNDLTELRLMVVEDMKKGGKLDVSRLLKLQWMYSVLGNSRTTISSIRRGNAGSSCRQQESNARSMDDLRIQRPNAKNKPWAKMAIFTQYVQLDRNVSWCCSQVRNMRQIFKKVFLLTNISCSGFTTNIANSTT